MPWTDIFNAVFFLSVGTIFCGGLGVTLACCLKAKCAEFRLFSTQGCLYIRRDVDAENAETKMELDHIPQQTHSQPAV